MAGVHFTTIPCEPNTANRLKESHIFRAIRPSDCTFIRAMKTFREFAYIVISFYSVSPRIRKAGKSGQVTRFQITFRLVTTTHHSNLSVVIAKQEVRNEGYFKD